MLQHFSSVSFALDSIHHSFRPETFPARQPRSQRALSKEERALQQLLEQQLERIRIFTVVAHIRLSAYAEEHNQSDEECWHRSRFEGLTIEAEILLTSKLFRKKTRRALRDAVIAEAARCLGSEHAAQTWMAIIEYDIASRGTVRKMRDLVHAMREWSSN